MFGLVVHQMYNTRELSKQTMQLRPLTNKLNNELTNARTDELTALRINELTN